MVRLDQTPAHDAVDVAPPPQIREVQVAAGREPLRPREPRIVEERLELLDHGLTGGPPLGGPLVEELPSEPFGAPECDWLRRPN